MWCVNSRISRFVRMQHPATFSSLVFSVSPNQCINAQQSSNHLNHITCVCRHHIMHSYDVKVWGSVKWNMATYNESHKSHCLFVYKALHGLAPVYIKSMCVPVSSSTARSSLRSASRGHLIVPRTRLEFGKGAPLHSPVLRLGTVCLTLCEVLNLSTLSKDRLKSFLFSVSYPSLSFSVTACSASSSY